MSTCNDCRFWNRNGDALSAYRNVDGDLEKAALPHHKCFKIIHGNGDATFDQAMAAPAMTCDGSGYSSTVWTKPDFGCNAFEVKEST